MVRLVSLINKSVSVDMTYVGYGQHMGAGFKTVSPLFIVGRRLLELVFKGRAIAVCRLLQEIWFDLLMLAKFNKGAVVVYFCYAPVTAWLNARRGGQNIFVAGNPYERSVADLLQRHHPKSGFGFNDPYCFTPRLWFIDKFLRLQEHVIAQSTVTYDSYSQVIDPDKLFLARTPLIPEDTDVQALNLRKRDSRDGVCFVYLAHTVELKGLRILLEAWRGASRLNSRLVVGGKVASSVSKSLCVEGLEGVEFLGPVSDLQRFYNNGDVCIVPSLLDDHPATIGEALMYGLPVVSTDGCGDSFLIEEGRSGFVLKAGCSVSLARKIEWFDRNVEKIDAMSEFSRLSVERYRGKKSELSSCINSIFRN